MTAVTYLSYYQLDKPPFDGEYDDSCLWLGKQTAQVYADVDSALTRNESTIFISGEEGLGKTTLLQHLKNRYEDTYKVTYCSYLPGHLLQVFSQIASELSIHKRFSNKSEFLILLRNKLQNVYGDQKRWLLLVDNAHLIKKPIVKELYMLSKIRMHGQSVVQIVFAGAVHILDGFLKYQDTENHNTERLHHELMPLSKEDTFQYINHRLQAAGRSKTLFKEDALKKVYINSRGIPRSINVICKHALEEGFKLKKKTIKADIINRCIGKVNITAAKEGDDKKNHPVRNKVVNYDKKDRRLDRFTALYLTIGVLAVLLFVSLAGYYYFEFLKNDTKQWEIEEIAPKENPLINEQLGKEQLKDELPVSGSPVEQGAATRTEIDTDDIPAKDRQGRSAGPLATKAGQSTDDALLEDKITVHFEYDSNNLPDDAYIHLNRLAEALAERPWLDVIIRGYTDSSGKYSYNVTISKIRAEAVASYLMARGVPPGRIETFGLGPTNPIQSNQTAKGRRLNRRVEIEVYSR